MMLSAWASTQSGVMASTPARTRTSDAFTNGMDRGGSWSRRGCEPGYLSAVASGYPEQRLALIASTEAVIPRPAAPDWNRKSHQSIARLGAASRLSRRCPPLSADCPLIERGEPLVRATLMRHERAPGSAPTALAVDRTVDSSLYGELVQFGKVIQWRSRPAAPSRHVAGPLGLTRPRRNFQIRIRTSSTTLSRSAEFTRQSALPPKDGRNRPVLASPMLWRPSPV